MGRLRTHSHAEDNQKGEETVYIRYADRAHFPCSLLTDERQVGYRLHSFWDATVCGWRVPAHEIKTLKCATN